ncbi:MAG: sugar ABC transporter permease [Sphaerochaeta sp.]|nr:sugar ABC transporter permease [Sphaerochaeta sp.]
MKTLTRKQFGYLCMAPTLMIFLIFAIYPVFRTILLSLYRFRLQTGPTKTFIGLDNYFHMFGDSRFFNALFFTLLFTLLTVVTEVILGLIFAQLMNLPFKGRGALRVVVLIPWAIPTIVSGFMWKFMVHDQYGVFNQILQTLGIIDSFLPWLSRDTSARLVLIMSDIWKTAPYVSLLVLAGLQTIPKTLYEAAAIDGAGPIRRYFSLTLPLLKPVLATAVLFRLISSFKVFTVIVALTNGGPGYATESLTMYTMRTYFDAGNYGYGSALATFTLFVTCIIALLFTDVIRGKIDGGKRSRP